MHRIRKTVLIWDIAYVCYFLSFFLGDMAIESETIRSVIEKIVRYSAYSLFVVVLCMQVEQRRHRIVICALSIAVAAFCTVYTRDLYYETLIFVIFTSYTIKPKHIIKISYYLLICLTAMTLIGVLAHMLPMVNSPRGDGSGDRLALGFYHSDVLPLILFYLIVYRIIIAYKHVKLWQIGLWAIAAVVLYRICGSKNGLIGILMLCIGCLLFRKKKKRSRLLSLLSKYLIVALSVFSLGAMLIQGSGSGMAQQLNKLMTGRFGIAYRQYVGMGLHLVNKMDWSSYREAREVLDNGYLYIAMRYGLAFLPFYWATHIVFSKKNKRIPLALGTSIVITLTNFIDNDLVSYGYLPFILLAFSKYSVEE